MKVGRSIENLAKEVLRQEETCKDLLAPTQAVTMQEDATLRVDGHGTVGVNNHAHGQIAQYLKIPQQYYKRCAETNPELLAQNVNQWMQQRDDMRMVRLLDNSSRAFLSDKYRAFDNAAIMETAYNTLENVDCKIESCEITETRFYMKAVSQRLTQSLQGGAFQLNDVVQAGVIITNSEVGAGALKVEPLLFRLVCLNGMIQGVSTGNGMRRTHSGSKLAQELGAINNAIQWSAETQRTSDKAVMLQIEDTIKSVLSPEGFQRTVKSFDEAKETKIDGDPAAAVKVIQKTNYLTDADGSGILRRLVEGGELNKFGMVNAITRHAQDVESYDHSTDLERIGGKVLDLSDHQWRAVQVAA